MTADFYSAESGREEPTNAALAHSASPTAYLLPTRERVSPPETFTRCSENARAAG
jgi:hypothetical protein